MVHVKPCAPTSQGSLEKEAIEICVCVEGVVGGLGDPQHSHLAESSMVGGDGGEVAFRQVNSRKLIMKGLEMGLGVPNRWGTWKVSYLHLRGFMCLPHFSTQTIKLCWAGPLSAALSPQRLGQGSVMWMVPCPDPLWQGVCPLSRGCGFDR